MVFVEPFAVRVSFILVDQTKYKSVCILFSCDTVYCGQAGPEGQTAQYTE